MRRWAVKVGDTWRCFQGGEQGRHKNACRLLSDRSWGFCGWSFTRSMIGWLMERLEVFGGNEVLEMNW